MIIEEYARSSRKAALQKAHEKKRFAGIEAEIARLREEVAMLKLVNQTHRPGHTIEAIAAARIEEELGPTQIVGSKPAAESWLSVVFGGPQEAPKDPKPNEQNVALEEYKAAKKRREEADHGLSEAHKEEDRLSAVKDGGKMAVEGAMRGVLQTGVGTGSHPAAVLGLNDTSGKGPKLT